MELLRQFGFKKIEMVDPQYDETKIKKKIPIIRGIKTLNILIINFKIQIGNKEFYWIICF